MRLHYVVPAALLLMIAIALSTNTGCSAAHQQTIDPLPALADIESMEFSSDDGRRINFKVPQSNWEAIFKCLTPARRDDSPKKWAALGQLSIVRKSAQPLMVFLFETSDGPGAFAAGETWETRIYFRGGDSQRLRQALDEAHRESVSQNMQIIGKALLEYEKTHPHQDDGDK
jgi:hypothetical protein